MVIVVAFTLGILLSTCCNKEEDSIPNPSTPVPQQPVVDIDGNTYQTVKIGNQVWMKEN